MRSTSTSTSTPSSEIFNLDAKRKALEVEAKAITDELTQPSVDEKGNRTMLIGIDTPLVDDEGYPRADIDVCHARGLRQRLNEIRHDHKMTMKQIESKLMSTAAVTSSSSKKDAPSSSSTFTATATATANTSVSHDTEIFISKDELEARKARKPKPKFDKETGKWVVCNWDGTVAGIENGHLRSFDKLNSTGNKGNNRNNENKGKITSTASIENGLSSSCTIEDVNDDISFEVDNISNNTFAKINEIHESSPAAKGGLQLNDAIVKIGSVDCNNHRNLFAVAEVVQRALLDDDTVDFFIVREIPSSQKLKGMNITIKPAYWEGNGILGCRIDKI